MMLLFKALGLSGEVIRPSCTFMATAGAVVWAGCTPVFVDVDEPSMVVDPEEVERAVGPRTSAIVAVHNFGRPAPVERLEEIARSRGLRLFFDSAHGMGSHRKGKPLGGFGDAEVFSLSPTKLVTSGEGGVVTTDSDETAGLVRAGRDYGNPGNYDCLFPGLSARMSELHAVLGLASLGRLAEGVRRRNEIASAGSPASSSRPSTRWIGSPARTSRSSSTRRRSASRGTCSPSP
jgi:dTDP-4-amino-4,6-dideoxygalactose transaminase